MSAAPNTGGINNPQTTPMLKAVNKFLLQAKKLDKVEPVIAYYCRMYAIQSIMKLPKKAKEELKLVSDLMGWMETNQTLVKGLSKDDARARVEAFALQVFEHADTEDRAGTANKQTALTFHSAYIFMEVCKQFGELATDLQQKIKYSMWKTTDITRALKEGRTPKPGGADEDEFGGGGGDGGFIEDEKSVPPSGFSDPFPSSQQPQQSIQPFATSTSTPSQPQTQTPTPTPSQTPAFQPSPAFQPPPPNYTPAFQPSPQPQTPAFQPPQQTPPFQASSQQTPSFQPSTPSPAPAPASAPGPAHAAFPAPSAIRPSSAASIAHVPQPSLSPSPTSGLSLPPGGVSQVVPGGWMIRPAKSEDRTRGMLEGERLVKHALNDLRMDDVNMAATKLQQALAYLLPYVTKQG